MGRFYKAKKVRLTNIGWHPAKGRFGLFETSGSSQAKKATKALDSAIGNVRNRKQGVLDFYDELADYQAKEEAIFGEEKELFKESKALDTKKNVLGREAGQHGYLSSMENFLMDSYNLGFKSDSLASRKNLASTSASPEEYLNKVNRRRGIGSAQEAQTLQDLSFRQGITEQGLGHRQQELGFEQKELGFERARTQLDMEELKQLQAIEDMLAQLKLEKTQYT